MSLITTWDVEIRYLDSAGHDVYQHWSSASALVFAGTLEQVIELCRDYFPNGEIQSFKRLGRGAVLGLDKGLEDLARAQFDDGLLMSDECRGAPHHERYPTCHGSVYGIVPDGKFTRPCECPCHGKAPE